jgi:hypothetical protein
LQKFREQAGQPISALQLTDELTRLNAVFGSPKDRTMDQIRVMANEWMKALKPFGRATVHRAVSKLIQESKWWPALAEVLALCLADEEGWRDALGIKDDRRYVAEPDAFARDGRTEAEEIAHRAAMVASMRRDTGFNSAPIEPVAAHLEIKSASQSEIVTSQARNSCAARRARREKTCEPSCFRQSCALREAEAQ